MLEANDERIARIQRSLIVSSINVCALVLLTAMFQSRCFGQREYSALPITWTHDGTGDWLDRENWARDELPGDRSSNDVARFNRDLLRSSIISQTDIGEEVLSGFRGINVTVWGDLFASFSIEQVFKGQGTDKSFFQIDFVDVNAVHSSAFTSGDARAEFRDLHFDLGYLFVEGLPRTSILVESSTSGTAEASFVNSQIDADHDFYVKGDGASLEFSNSHYSASDRVGRVIEGGELVTGKSSSISVAEIVVGEGSSWVIRDQMSFGGFLSGSGELAIRGDESRLLLTGNHSDTIGQKITGNGGLRIERGTRTLSGSNSFSGGLFLEGGVTRVSRGGNTGGIQNTIHFDGGELRFLEADNFYTSTWNVKSDSTISTDSGLVEAVIHGDFTGNGQIEVKGAGKVFLRGDNSGFTGDFLVSDGQLFAGVNNSLGSQTTVTVNEGATFRLEGNEDWGSIRGDGIVDIGEYNARVFTTGTDTLEGHLRGSGTFTMAGTGEFRLGSLSVTTSRFIGDLAVTSGQLELNGFSVGNFDGTLTTSGEGVAELNTRSADLTFNGTLANNGRLLKTGSGTLTVSPTSSGQRGVVEVAEGTLRAIGRVPGDTLEMSGGTFEAGSNSLTVENLVVSPGESTVDTGTNSFFMRNLSGTGTLTKIGTGTMRSLASNADWSAFSGSLMVDAGITRVESMANANLDIGDNGTAEFRNETTDIGSLAGSGTLRIRSSGNAVVVGHDNTSSQFSGSITGDGTFHKTGTGTLTLTGEIGSSNLSVDQGIVRLASATATRFGYGKGINVAANSELHIDQEFTLRGALTGVGSISLSDGTALVTFQEDAGVFDGDVYVGSGRQLNIEDSFDFGGSLTGQGNVQLSAGTAAVTFRGNNESYGGNVSVGSGRTLNVGRSGSLGRNTSVEIASGGSVQLEGAEYWGGLSGHGSLDLKGFNGRIGQGNQHSVFSGRIIGSGDFAKIGAGEFTFNGDATGLTGDFTVMEGTLSGGGMFDSLTIADGAKLAIGNSPGRITTDSFELRSGALLEIELGGLLAGTEFDQFVVLGDADISGNLSVNLYNGFQLSAGQEFLIGDIRGDLMGQFAGLGEGGLVGRFGDHDLFVSYNAGNGNSVGLFTAVPEPSGVFQLLISSGLVAARRNRRI